MSEDIMDQKIRELLTTNQENSELLREVLLLAQKDYAVTMISSRHDVMAYCTAFATIVSVLIEAESLKIDPAITLKIINATTNTICGVTANE